MKTSNHKFRSLVPTVVLALIMTSCTSTKYAALPCPDLPQAPKTKEIRVPRNHKIFASRPTKKKNTRINRRNSKNNSNQIISQDQVIEAITYNVVNELSDESNTANIIQSPQINIQNSPSPSAEYNDNVIENVESQPFATETNYLKVKSVSPYIPKHSSSEAKILKSTNNYQDSSPQIEGLGLAGFVSGIVGLLIFGIPLGTVAIVFGAISLAKIKKNPKKFSGRGFAIASLTLGIINVVAVILLLALIL